MNQLYTFLIENGLMLLLGTTVIMLIGTLLSFCFRAPIYKQRTTEFTILASLLWLGLACVPLPRYDISPLISVNSDAAIIETVDPVSASIESEQIDTEQGDSEEIEQTDLVESEITDSSITPIDPLTKEISESIELSDEEKAKLLSEILVPDNTIQGDEQEKIVNRPVIVDPIETVSEPLPINQQPLASEIEPQPEQATVSLVVRFKYFVSENMSQLKFFLFEIYLVGGLLSFIWLLIGQYSLFRIKRKSVLPEKPILELFHEIQNSRSLRKADLRVSSQTDRAMTFGVIKPVVLLPENLCTEKNRETLKQVLLHEMAHVEQYDAIGRLLFNFAFPLFYFHPLFWWLRTSAYHSAELVADESAALESSRTEYAEALISLIKKHPNRSVLMNNAMPIFKTPSSFYRRMEMLVTRTNKLETRLSRFWKITGALTFGAILLAATSVLGIRQLQADPEKDNITAAAVDTADNPSSEKNETVKETKDDKASENNKPVAEKSVEKKPAEAESVAKQPAITDSDEKKETDPVVKAKEKTAASSESTEEFDFLKSMKNDGTVYEAIYFFVKAYGPHQTPYLPKDSYESYDEKRKIDIQLLKSFRRKDPRIERIKKGVMTKKDDIEYTYKLTATADVHKAAYKELKKGTKYFEAVNITTSLKSYHVPNNEQFNIITELFKNKDLKQFWISEYEKTEIIHDRNRNRFLVISTPKKHFLIKQVIEFLQKPAQDVSGVKLPLGRLPGNTMRSPTLRGNEEIYFLTSYATESDDLDLKYELIDIARNTGRWKINYPYFKKDFHQNRILVVTTKHILNKIIIIMADVDELPVVEKPKMKARKKKGLGVGGFGRRENNGKISISTKKTGNGFGRTNSKNQVDPNNKKAKATTNKNGITVNGISVELGKTNSENIADLQKKYGNDPYWNRFTSKYKPIEIWNASNLKSEILGFQIVFKKFNDEIPALRLKLYYRVSQKNSHSKLAKVIEFVESSEFENPSALTRNQFTQEELVQLQVKSIYERLTGKVPSNDEMKYLVKLQSKSKNFHNYSFKIAEILGQSDLHLTTWYDCKIYLQKLDELQKEIEADFKKLTDPNLEPTIENFFLLFRLNEKIKTLNKSLAIVIKNFDDTKPKGVGGLNSITWAQNLENRNSTKPVTKSRKTRIAIPPPTEYKKSAPTVTRPLVKQEKKVAVPSMNLSAGQSSTGNVDLIRLATKFSDVVQQYQAYEIQVKFLEAQIAVGAVDADKSLLPKVNALQNQIQFIQKLAKILMETKKAEFENLHEAMERVIKLSKKGIISQKEVNDQRAKLIKAKLDLEILQLILDDEYANSLSKKKKMPATVPKPKVVPKKPETKNEEKPKPVILNATS
jgi:beta-lactamase regulating signal transducer with metallopeptidase domain